MPALDELLAEVTPATVAPTDYAALQRRARGRMLRNRSGVAVAIVAVIALMLPLLRPGVQAFDIEPVSPDAVGPWQAMSPSPLGPRRSADWAADGTRLLIWGGEVPVADTSTGSDRQEAFDGAIYDLDTDAWTAIPTPPVPVLDPRPALYGDRVLLMGGRVDDDASVRQGGQAYSLSSGRWESVPAAPFLTDYRSYRLDDASLVAYEGRQRAALDPRTLTWERLPDQPSVPQGSGSGSGGGWMLAFGGSDNLEQPVLAEQLHDDGVLIDLASGEREALPPGPLSARRNPFVAWVGGRFLVWGGQAEDQEGWQSSSSFEETPPSSSCDGDECMTSLGGTISVSPGAPPIEREDGAWFDPATRTWEAFDPAALVDADTLAQGTLGLEMLAPDLLLATVTPVRGEGLAQTLVDTTTLETVVVDTSERFWGELVGDRLVQLPELRTMIIRDEWRQLRILADAVDGVAQVRSLTPPQTYPFAVVAHADGRVVIFGGVQHPLAPPGFDFRTDRLPPPRWLDGGWVLDVRSLQL